MARKDLRLVSNAAPPTPTGKARTERRRKTSKRETILREAAAMFNERGINAVSLSDVAQQLGFGRATLYHYVADREDLVFQCFQRSVEADTEWLDAAADEQTGLQRVLRYLRDSMAVGETESAIITDTTCLSAEARAIIEKGRLRNHRRLESMIGEGVEDRSMRPCDEQILARVLPSMVSYMKMAPQWISPRDGSIDPEAVLDFMTYGSAVDPSVDIDCPIDADTFSRLRAASFDRESLSAMRIEQLLMTASHLINKRGIDGVSLEDVASALGATRGAFYHYLNDKEDLVRRCLDRGVDLYEGFFDAAEKHAASGLEKASIVTHLNVQAQVGTLQPALAWMGLDILSPTQNRRHKQHMQALLNRGERMAEEGIADGSRRAHHVRSIAIVRAGAYLWIPRWIEEIDAVSPRRVADEIVAFFNKGLALQ